MDLKSKKIKNNKGFSLIELLAAMVVLSIIGVITIVGVQRYINQSKEQKTIQNKKNVSLAAELYLQSNRDLFPKMIGDSVRVQLSDLKKANYIKEDVRNENDEDCMKESYVLVRKIAENEYAYVTELICGNDKAPEKDNVSPPYLETITNEEGKSGKIVFSKSTDVKTASFSFKLHGMVGNDNIKLASYAYTILGKTSLETEYNELYNSGIIDANDKKVVEFKSRPINAYVDLAGVTNIRVKVTALNEKGGYLTYDETMDNGKASGENEYEDKEKPKCPPVYEYGSRLGEPTSLDDWVNKLAIGTEKYPRIVTIKCDDGNGSGCKRDTFSQAWPNVNLPEQQYGVMFGSIRIEDNAVINENGKKKENPNYEDCDINIFVDLQAPTVEITPINPAPQKVCGKDNDQLCPSKVGTNIMFNDVIAPTGSTVVVKDPTNPLENEIINNSLVIDTTNYLNAYINDLNQSEGWLNKEYYPQGIEYDVVIKDNLYLDSYTWEVNDRWHNTNSKEMHNTYGTSDESHPEASSWNRREDPNSDMYVDETLLFEQKENYHFNNEHHFKIHFYDEGARYGVLTVRDRAGNETKVYIHANLDRTEPPLDSGDYDFLAFNKLKIGLDKPLEYVDQDLDGEIDYQYEPYDVAPEEKDPQLIGGFHALTDSKQFRDHSTETDCYGCDDDSGGGYPEIYKIYGVKRDPQICYPQTTNGYGIIEGTDYPPEVINTMFSNSRTGCYKVGVEKGDNQFSGKPRINYEDPDVFRELKLTGQEYKQGTWSNEELVCGPYESSTFDDWITERLPDGTFYSRPNPNNEEISKWGGTRILYYKQTGVAQDPDDPDKLIPVQDMNQVPRRSIITRRNRSQWPKYTDQGTHKLIWSNCDVAGNCSGFKLQEYIKIDTIAPQCNNSVRYNDKPNSDGTTGPNHNGWLYDEQVATVYHDCADSSHKEYDNYFKAYFHLKDLTEQIQAPDNNPNKFKGYNEYGSGCTNESPTTDTMDYSYDVYTCSAGTDGIGAGNLGRVEDYAGNIRKCTLGATVRKDTSSPMCAARAFYEGKNGDGNYNTPNIHGWAIGGMSIYTKDHVRIHTLQEVVMKTLNHIQVQQYMQ